jgi:hypothetical protein
MAKRIIPLFLLPPLADLNNEAKARFDRVVGEDQGIDLRPCLDPSSGNDIDRHAGVVERLSAGLRVRIQSLTSR